MVLEQPAPGLYRFYYGMPRPKLQGDVDLPFAPSNSFINQRHPPHGKCSHPILLVFACDRAATAMRPADSWQWSTDPFHLHSGTSGRS